MSPRCYLARRAACPLLHVNEDDAVHNPAAKSGSDRSSCPDALPTDLSAADDLSFEEACPPSPLSCPRCVEGGCTGFVVPAQSEVEFTGLVRL